MLGELSSSKFGV